MPFKRYKRKSADALSRQLRRRFYIGSAIATCTYVALSIIKFYARVSYLAQELAIIWSVFLLCYTSFREVLRWNNVNDAEKHHGEIWVGIVLAGGAWMFLWNIGRSWFFRLPTVPFPEDYVVAIAETLVLYTLSSISSFLYRYKHKKSRAHRQAGASNIRNKHADAKEKTSIAVQAVPAAEIAPNSEPETVLTVSPPPEAKENIKKDV